MDGIAYFDNAATTYPKPECVYDFADNFYRHFGGNIGRGSNALSMSAGEIAGQAKDNIRELLNCPSRKVILTSTATEALNRVIFGLDLPHASNVYVTPFEHNAVTRPLHQLEKTLDATITVLSFREDTLTADLEGIAQQFDAEKPDLVVMTHASNVIGTIAPVLEIATIAKKYGAITVIDMSQTAGLVPIDLATNLIDYAVFAGHKALMGPFGVGGFACLDSASLKPVLFGGNGINSLEQDMPDDIVAMSEVGSQNTYAIAGLYASTKWIIEKGIDTLQSQEQANRDQLLRLLDGYPNIRIIGNADGGAYTGVVSAVFDRYSPDEIEMVLNKCHVAVRSGLHCSPYAHRFLGTLPAGTVRFSVSPLTTENEFLTLDNALRLIEES